MTSLRASHRGADGLPRGHVAEIRLTAAHRHTAGCRPHPMLSVSRATSAGPGASPAGTQDDRVHC